MVYRVRDPLLKLHGPHRSEAHKRNHCRAMSRRARNKTGDPHGGHTMKGLQGLVKELMPNAIWQWKAIRKLYANIVITLLKSRSDMIGHELAKKGLSPYNQVPFPMSSCLSLSVPVSKEGVPQAFMDGCQPRHRLPAFIVREAACLRWYYLQ